MTQEEYTKELAKLNEEYRNSLFELKRQRCKTMIDEAGITLGSLVENHYALGVVTGLRTGGDDRKPYPVLVCERTKKDGTPRVKPESIHIHFSDIRSVK